jgi:hypothetical protein
MLTLLLKDVVLEPQVYEGEVAMPQEAPEDEPMPLRRLHRTEACRPEGSDQDVACRSDGSGARRAACKAASEPVRSLDGVWRNFAMVLSFPHADQV